jgi:hypothetical protein
MRIFRLDPYNFHRRQMHFHFFQFLVVAKLAVLVHANTTPGIRAEDIESTQALDGILDNSNSFSPKVEVIMPRIEEWLVQMPIDVDFSAIINASSVFTKLSEYVVESEGVRNPNASFTYSSNENETTVEFEKGPVKELKLTLLFRASEHEFLASEFHRLCDGKGPTITLVKAVNERMAAAFSGVNWDQYGLTLNPQGFLASIVDDPGAIGGYSLQKYAANENAAVYSYPNVGPYFGNGLSIRHRCNVDERSRSHLGPRYGYGPEEVDPSILFGSTYFRVLEYEVFQVEVDDIV